MKSSAGCAALAPFLLLAGACRSGASYVSINLDTDAPVPRLVDRVRIDVFSARTGVWSYSQDYGVQAPAASSGMSLTGIRPADLSLPFSFALDGGSAAAILRVRAYTERHVRDYLGERLSSTGPDAEAGPESGSCAAPLVLRAGEPLAFAVDDVPAQGFGADACDGTAPATEPIAATFAIGRPGRYQFAIDVTSPAWPWLDYALPWMSLARACDASAASLPCQARSIKQASGQTTLTAELDPGDYVLRVANQKHATFEARLVFGPAGTEGGATDAPSTAESEATAPPEEAPIEPRLIIRGVDRTPSVEPDPALAIDRLLLVQPDPDHERVLDVTLRSACFGSAADLIGRRTCVDRAGQLQSIRPETLHAPPSELSASHAGEWRPLASTGCSAPPPDGADAICVPGGVFLLGDASVIAAGADAASPERLAVIAAFYLDRTEYTVGRYLSALSSGLELSEPPFDRSLVRALGGDADAHMSYCTYDSSDVSDAARAMPLACVKWPAAEQLCAAAGGRLPTSAEWEFAASAAGKGGLETSFAWGNDAPACADVVFGRADDYLHGHTDCHPLVGPERTDDLGSDLTSLGISGLGGNLGEWTSDSHRAYSAACWALHPLVDPRCDEPSPPLRTVKGGSWREAAAVCRSAVRTGAPPSAEADNIGFRCAYPAQPRGPR